MGDPFLVALGYFDLALFDEAWIALDDLPPEQKVSGQALALRVQILAKLGKWESLSYIARNCASLHPAVAEIRVLGAEAIRRTESLGAAYQFLMEGQGSCAQCAMWLYKAGSFEVLLGHQSEAREKLRQAFQLDPELRAKALDDPDLAKFWDDP